jgi:hypothetical protein
MKKNALEKSSDVKTNKINKNFKANKRFHRQKFVGFDNTGKKSMIIFSDVKSTKKISTKSTNW